MPTLAERNNNPGNLTVNRPGQILYPGQTGTMSANGLTYAVFPNAQSGFNALVDYIRRHTQNGSTTIGSFISHYLGTPGLTADAANANPRGYAGTVARAVGGDLNSIITPSNYIQVARGIAQGEGGFHGIEGLTGNIGAGDILGSGGSSINTPSPNANLLSAVGNFFRVETQERIVAVTLGVVLIAIALGVMLLNSKTVQENVIQPVVKAAKTAAVVAV